VVLDEEAGASAVPGCAVAELPGVVGSCEPVAGALVVLLEQASDEAVTTKREATRKKRFMASH
jgi:hypothetical protein